MNKFDYTFDICRIEVKPRVKSEFQRYRPPLRLDDQSRVDTTELQYLVSLVLRIPILTSTSLQAGLEYLIVEQFREQLEDDLVRSDRNELVYALQFTNNASYLGYNLWTQTGVRLARIDREAAERTRTETALFLTVYAGLD